MKGNINSLIKKLGLLCNRFDEGSRIEKSTCLDTLAEMHLSGLKTLVNYSQTLLFLCAYPGDADLLSKAERELARLTSILKKNKIKFEKELINSGLPFTKYASSFSHDFLRWLIEKPELKIDIDRFENTSFTLNEVLKLTLPSMEKSETTAGLRDADLLDVLLVKKQNRISFIMNELTKLNETPYIKDHFFDGLGLYTSFTSESKDFSLLYNRLPIRYSYFHSDLSKSFDHRKLFDSMLPEPESLSAAQLKMAVAVVKNSMALTDRETDPVTYMDPRSFRLYHLERGISVAIYGMVPGRQLPLESYVGYTLFKNGFPAAYGGSWVFGESANFGINIFQSFRGGESGYMMCQLLRVFIQVFDISYFEVEPYQFGLDNPEGIASGAFWFYYRYGFRPSDKRLSTIAEMEYGKISRSRDYRTKKEVLIRFTESTMVLQLGKKNPAKVPDISSKVIKTIQQVYNGDRLKASQESVLKFRKKSGLVERLNNSEKQVLQEVALWAEAFHLDEIDKLKLLKQMISTKPVNLYKYQELLLRFFGVEK